MTIKSFKLKNTGLCSWIVKNCEKKNIIYATSIQQTIIPSIISGKDSLLFSRTGTGNRFIKHIIYWLKGGKFLGFSLIKKLHQ